MPPTCSNCGATDFVWANELKTGGGLSGAGTLSLRPRGETPLGTRICRSCGHADLFLRDLSLLHKPHLWKPGEFVPIQSPKQAAKAEVSHHGTSHGHPAEAAPGPTAPMPAPPAPMPTPPIPPIAEPSPPAPSMESTSATEAPPSEVEAAALSATPPEKSDAGESAEAPPASETAPAAAKSKTPRKRSAKKPS